VKEAERGSVYGKDGNDISEWVEKTVHNQRI